MTATVMKWYWRSLAWIARNPKRAFSRLCKILSLVFSGFSVFGGITVFGKDFTIFPESEEPAKIQIELLGGVGGSSLDCGQRAGKNDWLIAPFSSGYHDKLEHGSLNVAVRTIVESMRAEAQRGHHISGLVLIGSADKSELKPSRQRTYGSNFILAQKRADYVKDSIDAAWTEGAPPAVIAIPRGATIIGEPNSSKRGDDRSVQICALWG